MPPEAEFTVRPEDTDKNGHMNNAVYLDWLDRVLPGDFYSRFRLTELTIAYKKELLPGQSAPIRVRREDGALTVQGLSEGKPAFTASVRYAPLAAEGGIGLG